MPQSGLGVAVVGSNGFVGSALVRRMRTGPEGFRVLSLGRAEMDLLRPETWPDLAAVDCVIHAAGLNGGSPYDVMNANALSADGFAKWCNRCGVRKLIYLSTGSVYGTTDEATEPSRPCAPMGAYALSKYTAECKLREVFRGQLHILRLYFPWGTGQTGPRLIPTLLDSVRNGRTVSCRPDGGPFLTISHVDDVCEAIVSDFVLQESPVSVCNLGSDHALSVEGLAKAIGAALGIPPRIEYDGTSANIMTRPYLGIQWRGFDPSILL